ncbi:DUF4347 domain-containing protein [Kordiimonas marina]|uniref:DUF4347 domain-containing protein n=1 Tax=Kordiimonas marina TaxID=2872312 RepID=UPI001FF4D057|nr:DUF4347 domain-containing protein [Kordiimonas marina]MCJ9429439.1 VCBS domain-containing protein [Kordiimonas marina]
MADDIRTKRTMPLGGTSLSSLKPLPLESRYMYDAAGVATGAQALQDAAATAEANAAAVSRSDGGAHGGHHADQSAPASSHTSGRTHDSRDVMRHSGDRSHTGFGDLTAHAVNSEERHDIVVIDTSVSDYQSLLAGVNPNAEVILIDGTSHGIADLAAQLAGRTGISSITILSHGSVGEFQLGTDVVNSDTLASYTSELAAIGKSLTADGDLLLYGCDVGQSGQGMAFIDNVASITGADVAASNDLTGAADKGGDWVLEVATGTIESKAAFDGLRTDFTSTLALTIGTKDFGTSISILATDSAGPVANVGGSGLSASYSGSSTMDIGLFASGDGYAVDLPSHYGEGVAWSGEALQFCQFAGSGGGAGYPATLNYISLKSDNGTDTFRLDGFVFFYSTTSASQTFTVSAYDSSGTQIGSSTTLTGFTTATDQGFNVGYTTVSSASLGADFNNIVEFRIAPSTPSTMSVMGVDNVVVATAISNSAPTVSSAPTSVTVTEDTASNLNLSGTTFADANSDPLTVTLAVDAGTLSASSSGGVTVGGTSTALTLSGTASAINTYLTTTSNIKYTGATNANGTGAATLTVTPNDGTVDGTAATVSIDISAVNDVPVFTGLDGTPTFTENGSAVTLDTNVTVSDVELDAAADYAGASLTIARNGGASANDGYGFNTSGALFTVSGSNLQSGGQTFATFSDTGGTLTINFTSTGTAATAALVDDVLQHIQYSNSSNEPASSAQLDWTFSDGNSANAQGTGSNPGTVTGSTTVSITAVNDAPTLTATAADPGFTEGGTAVSLFSAATASTVESGQTFSTITFTVSNVDGTSAEALSLDGTSIALVNGGSGTTATNSLSYSVSVTSGTATVSLTGGTMDAAAVQSLITGATYVNTSDNPTSSGSTRAVTITSLKDSGGTANSGSDTATLSIASTVSVSAVNDGPTATGVPTSASYTEDTAGNLDLSGMTLADVDAGSASVSLKLSAGGGTMTATSSGGVTVGGSGSGSLTLSGTVANINTFLGTASNIKYTGGSNVNGTGADTITVKANDGGNTGTGGGTDVTLGSISVDITAVNDAPVVTTPSSALGYTEGDSATAIDSGITVSDVDNATLASATVSITGNFSSSQDTLAFTNTSGMGNITGSYNSTTGVLTLTSASASATTAEWQAALRAVTYSNSSNDPSTSARTVSFVVSDGTANSTAATQTVNVTALNDAPTLTATASDPSFTEGGSAVTLFSAVTPSTVETGQTFSAITFTVTNVDGTSAETLTLDGTPIALVNSGSGTTSINSLSYSVSVSSGTATVSLTGGTLDATGMQTLVTNAAYNNTSDDPTSSGSDRTITITSLKDSGGTANGGSDTTTLSLASTVSISAVNDNPSATGLPSSVTVTEDTAGNLDLSGVTLADPDAESGNLTLTLTATNGSLSATSNASVTVGGTSSAMTLTGTLASLNSFLGTASNIQYTGASNANGTAADSVAVKINDNGNTGTGGGTDVSLGTVSVNITAVNDAPVVTAPSSAASFTEGSGTPVVIDSGITVADVDSTTLATATVSVTGNFQTGHDTLAFTNTSGMGNITGAYNATTGVLTLSSSGATATVAEWQAALRAVTFANDSSDPGASGGVSRTISFVANDGTDSSTAVTQTVDISIVNDAPTSSTTGSDPSLTEGGSAVTLFSGTTSSTVDSSQTLTGFTATVTNVDGTSAETLTIDGTSIALADTTSGTTATNGLSYSVSVTSGTATVTLSGGSLSATAFNTVINGMTYGNSSDNPTGTATTRTITISGVKDNGGTANGGSDTQSGASGASTVTITPVNDAPVIEALGSGLTFTEGDSATAIDSSITVTDADSTTLATATVSITGGFTSTEDTLAFTNDSSTMGNITASYNSTTGVLTLNSSGASATVAEWQAALRAVTYSNSSNAPSTSDRTISYVVSDGTASSTAATQTVSVLSVNDAPSLTATGSDPTFTEGGSAVSLFSGTAIDTGETGQVVDTIVITVSNVANGSSEVLNVDSTAVGLAAGTGLTSGNDLDYSVAVSGTTATFTLNTGGMSAAGVQDLINAITYTNSSNDPASASATRTVTITSIKDGGGTANGGVDTTSLSVASTVTITDVNDAPTLTATGANPTYTEGGSVAYLFTGASASTIESSQSFTGLTFTVTNVDSGADEYISIDGRSIGMADGSGTTTDNSLNYSVSVSGTTATVTLTGGSLSAADFQTLIQGMHYSNASDNPGSNDRVVTITSVTDSGGTSNGGTDTSNVSIASTVSVTPVNDAPSVNTPSSSLDYTEGDSATAIDSGITVSDVDNTTLASATVSITGNFSSGEDALAFTNDGSTMGNIAASYESATGVLTLTSSGATATVAEWQAALRAVTYANSSNTPSTADRTVSFVVNDGTDNSSTATQTITVTTVNDNPTGSGLPATSTQIEDTAGNLDLSGFTLADVDAGSGSVTLTLAATHGTLEAASDASVTVGGSGTGTLTLTGSVSEIDVYLATASNIQYTSALNAEGTGADTIAVIANDNGNTGTGGGTDVSLGSISVNITGVNDPSVISGTYTGNVTEGNIGDAPVTATGDLSISDPDVADNPSFADVAATTGDNGYGSFALSSGTWTYTLDESKVQSLNQGDTVTDTHTFTATDGSTQVITITITGTNDPAVVSGTTTGSVTEGNVGDAPVTASGTMTISDADSNDSPSFANVASTVGDNGYGSFVLSSGTWTYTLDESTVQGLNDGDTVTDTHTFTATDGTTQTVTVTINGTSDASTVTGTSTGAVTEGNVGDAPVTASGTLAISNAGAGVSPSFSDVSATTGDKGYGSFTMTSGTWTYTLDESAVQSLNAGDTVTDTHTFTATDGTTQLVEITITGTNDAPAVSGTVTGATLTEDQSFSLQVPTFSDADSQDSVTLTAQLQGGGALPSWMNFNASTGTLSGTPTNINQDETLQVQIIATDSHGASTSATLSLTVQAAPVVVTTPTPVPVSEQGSGGTVVVVQTPTGNGNSGTPVSTAVGQIQGSSSGGTGGSTDGGLSTVTVGDTGGSSGNGTPIVNVVTGALGNTSVVGNSGTPVGTAITIVSTTDTASSSSFSLGSGLGGSISGSAGFGGGLGGFFGLGLNGDFGSSGMFGNDTVVGGAGDSYVGGGDGSEFGHPDDLIDMPQMQGGNSLPDSRNPQAPDHADAATSAHMNGQKPSDLQQQPTLPGFSAQLAAAAGKFGKDQTTLAQALLAHKPPAA